MTYSTGGQHPLDMSLGPSLSRTGSQEQLTGTVDGQTASDLEERFAKSLKSEQKEFFFRQRISSLLSGSRVLTSKHANLAGEIEIDFLINSDQYIPVMVDGEISHFMTPYQKQADEEKKTLVDEFGALLGWRETVRVPYVEIRSQTDTDVVVKKILEGSYIARYTT